jgi:hypothetical protein
MPKKYKKKDIPRLRYGVLHATYGLPDGVSIVMKQIDQVLQEDMNVDATQIYYLIGRSKNKGKNITQRELLSDTHPINKLMIRKFEKGYSEEDIKKIEEGISVVKKIISEFIEKKNIDIIIAHNTSHPVNFLFSLGLSRYYKEQIQQKKKTPKYILWWHDSHLERERFLKPARDVDTYLIEGIPGSSVEYILFINSLQYKEAQRYFQRLDEADNSFTHLIHSNHDIVYNTTGLYINTFEDLLESKNKTDVEHFLEVFQVKKLFEEKNTTFDKTIFCLQHTRIVPRKRIDFALEYTFSLLHTLRKRGIYESMYFLISGNDGDEGHKHSRELKKLHKKLSEKYNIHNHFLVLAEDYDKKAIPFEDYPRIFAKIGGITTYFSEVEGFGNNLLEVLASGLIPIVYTYPVFKSDIEKYKFKLIALDEFIVDVDSQLEIISLLQSTRKRKVWVSKNLKILKNKFNHRIIKSKLTRAIIRKRTHD